MINKIAIAIAIIAVLIVIGKAIDAGYSIYKADKSFREYVEEPWEPLNHSGKPRPADR